MIISSAHLALSVLLTGGQGAALPPADDIIVTGERAKRTPFSTASSVVVITAEDIANFAAPDRLDQVLSGIPNLQMGSQSSAPAIRGQDTGGALRDLSAFLGGNRPRTTLVVDGRATSFNEFVFGSQSLWEVSRVEVFRTPQSTTQGRNSIAGAIFVNTTDPTGRAEASARVILDDAETRHLSAMVNLPLSGVAGIRMAADWRDGRTASQLSDPSRPGADLSRDQTRLLRGKFEADPAWLGGGRLLATVTHSRSAMPQLEGVRVPFRDRRDASATYGFFRTRSDAITLQMTAPLSPGLSLDAVSSFGLARAQRDAPAQFGEADNQVRDMAGEVVIRRTALDGVKLTAGLAVARQKLDQEIDLRLVLGRGAFEDRQDSAGLFGEAEIGVAPRLTATLGLRYQWDRQRRDGLLGGIRGLEALAYAATSDFLLPRWSMAYALSPRLTVGATLLRASNPGGTTISVDGPLVFQPETSSTVELFARARLDGDRLHLRANLFSSRIRNAQRARNRVFRPPGGRPVTFSDILNVPRARSHGLEFDLNWDLDPSLNLQVSGALLATRLYPLAGQALGTRFQRAPRWSGRAAIAWKPLREVTASLQARGRAGYFSDDLNTPALQVGSGSILDGRLGWERDRVKLFAYGRNLTDRFLLTSYSNLDLATAEDPRELGIGLELRL